MSIFRNLWSRRFEISEKRMEICMKCEHYNEKLHQCKECGCFMEAKTLFASVECPVGKWGPVELNSDGELQELKDGRTTGQD